MTDSMADSTADSTAAAAATAEEGDSLDAKIVAALQTVYAPEIPVNIYEMGLIYDIAIGEDSHVDCTMTLTSPGCPVAGTLPGEVQAAIEGVDGVSSAAVELVWDPVWNPSMMSEAARLELGML